MKGVSRVVDPYSPYRSNGPLSIRTRSENCISLRDLEYLSPFTGVKGVSRFVDPYGLYRSNGPLSIRTQSENCNSLRALRIFFTVYLCEGGFTGCRSVRLVQIEWGTFNPSRSENCIS